MSDCIFCKIIAGEIPSEFVHEDENCVIFRDVRPKMPTHLLLVPRKHIPSIAELEDGDEKIIGHLIVAAQNIAKKLGLTGYQLQFNVGKEGGQEVFHVHLHLMSKFS